MPAALTPAEVVAAYEARLREIVEHHSAECERTLRRWRLGLTQAQRVYRGCPLVYSRIARARPRERRTARTTGSRGDPDDPEPGGARLATTARSPA